MDAHARLQRPLMRVQALEGRQQGGVDIDQKVAPALGEPGRQDAHETGQADNAGAIEPDRLVQRFLEGLAVLIVAVIDHLGLDPGLTRDGQARRIGIVRGHQHDLGRIVFVPGGLQQGLHVRTAPGNEHGDLGLRHYILFPA